LQHYLDGIQFALGDLPVDTAPMPFDVGSSFVAGKLDSLFDKAAAYEYGQSREALMNLMEYFRLAAVSPKLQQQQNEKRLLQLLAASLANEIPPTESVSAIVQTLPSLSPQSQVQLMASLAERRDAEVRQAAVLAAKGAHAEVRAAALQALNKTGDETTVILLAEIAANKSNEAAIARKSLYRLTGALVDETIVKNITAAEDANVKVELILAANQRRIEAATLILLQTAKDLEPNVRLESIHALKKIADDQYLPELLDLLMNAANASERSALEKTVIAVALKAPPERRKSETIMARLKAFPPGTNYDVRESLLKILGGIGDEAALPVLLAALGDTATQVKTAAILALSDWPLQNPARIFLLSRKILAILFIRFWRCAASFVCCDLKARSQPKARSKA